MKTYFFILALPRSLTSWLSVVLSPPDSGVRCIHDGFENVWSMTDMRRKLDTCNTSVVGNSDSFNLACIDEIKEAFPEARFVAIRRDIDDVLKSLVRCGLPIECEEIMRKAGAILDGIDKSIPQFSTKEIVTEDGARRLWSAIADDRPFPLSWFNQVRRLKIEPMNVFEGVPMCNEWTAKTIKRFMEV